MIKNQIFKFRENCPAPDRGPKKIKLRLSDGAAL
jgi:hypothetical protein